MEIPTFKPLELADYVRGRPVPDVQLMENDSRPHLEQTEALLGYVLHPAFAECRIDYMGADPKKHLMLLPSKRHLESVIQYYDSIKSKMDGPFPFFYKKQFDPRSVAAEEILCASLLRFYPSSMDFMYDHETFHIANCILGIKSRSLDEGLAIAYSYYKLLSRTLEGSIGVDATFYIINSDIWSYRTTTSSFHSIGFSQLIGDDFFLSREDIRNKKTLSRHIGDLDRKIKSEIEKIPEDSKPRC